MKNLPGYCPTHKQEGEIDMDLFTKKFPGLPYSNKKLINLLTEADKIDPQNDFLLNLYKRHEKYTPESLVNELREDASNTLTRYFTGNPDYNEIVILVADKIGIKQDELTNDEEKDELLIIRKMIQDYIKKHPEAKEQVSEVINKMGEEYNDFFLLLMQGSSAAFLATVEAMSTVAPSIVAEIVLQILMKFAGTQAILIAGRIAAMLVPFLNVFMGVWMVATIAGPAYRKIVPSVIDIALLRLNLMNLKTGDTDPS